MKARGTYKAVKGIIPLQAYIRGQLVRRQAISALYCVKSIVRFQALARGYKVRHSEIGLAVRQIFKVNILELIISAQSSVFYLNFFNTRVKGFSFNQILKDVIIE